MQPHRGVLILVFGILGFILCPILSIIAWVMGRTDLVEMDAGRMDPEGRSLTKAGQILGIIGTALLALGVGITILFLLVAIVTSAGAH